MDKKIIILLLLVGFTNLSAQLDVDFKASQVEGCGSLEVIFDNLTTSSANGDIIFSWDIAGIISDRINPGKIFDIPGRYTVCLTATDGDGNTDQKCKNDYIVIHDLPTVDFNLDITKGCAPLEINFTNHSTSDNNIVSMIWDVGGSTNVVQNQDLNEKITSQYSAGGKYSVSLTIVDDKNCSNTLSRKDIIEVLSPRKPLLTKQFLSTCGLPWLLEFTNNDIQDGVIYNWDFGNAKTFEGNIPPTIQYDSVGNYTVKVLATQANCSEEFVFENFVNTTVRASIDYSDSINCVGSAIEFKDNTSLGADSIKWIFDDGTVYYDKIIEHSFNTSGCHNLSLYRYRTGCIDSITIDCIEIKEVSPYSYSIENQYSCKTPVTINLHSSGAGLFTWAINNGIGIDSIDGENVEYQLDNIGNYSADLIFKGTNGCSIIEKNIPIKIEKFDVNLPSRKPGICVGETVTLNDSIVSKLPIVNWHWEIMTEDVMIFNDKSPSFVIDKTGSYDVKLIVENSIGCIDTIERIGYIRVGNRPNIDFDATPLDDCIESERTFVDQSTGEINEWFWTFGDSTFSKDQNPVHTYSTIDTFDVSLYVAHNGCGVAITKEMFVNTVKPLSSFSVDFDCTQPTDVIITNNSIGADSSKWTIEVSPSQIDIILDSLIGSYQFPDFGRYPITLWSKNIATGCEHTTTDTLFIGKPQALYVPDTTFGCLPLEVTFSNKSVNADSIFYYYNDQLLTKNKITFDSFGVYDGPVLIAQDINACRDTFVIEDIIRANEIKAIPNFNAVICAPDSLLFTDHSIAGFTNIIDHTWTVNEHVINDTVHKVYFDHQGVYDLSYRIKDSWGCVDSILIPNAIDVVEVNPQFIADSLGCTSTNIKFIPSGNDANTSGYLWTFGDGTTSDEQVPNHQYDTEGLYEICLTLSDIRGCQNKLCKEDYIDIKDPHASFDASPIEAPCPPLLTNFTNQSRNATAYEWNFGDDSGTSRNEDPSHVYSEPDTFSVSLIAIRSDICADTFSIKDLIELKGPKAEISYNLEGNCLPLTINLSAQSDKPYKYFWDFGNGDVDTSTSNIMTD